jgi:hypothetical protein
MKNTFIVLLLIAILGVGYYFYSESKSLISTVPSTATTTETTPTGTTTKPVVGATPTNKAETIIGASVDGNNIIAYHFGSGTNELLFVGGIHGGYEWNTVLVAYELMDYLKANPSAIPKNIKVTVIPVLNPDGLKKVVGTTGRFSKDDVSPSTATVISGRFNSHTVDLNRNFDCDWQAKGVWQTKAVSGGTSAFSEPESQAMKKYVASSNPTAVIVWYSAGGGVYASSCHNGVTKSTDAITKIFADASGYTAHQSFDSYETTGDMVNWLAKNSITAISVLLTNHTDTEWTKNLAGVLALFKYYTE